jgi:hypothetical protein
METTKDNPNSVYCIVDSLINNNNIILCITSQVGQGRLLGLV